MKAISGDLIHLAKNGEFDLIVHGCNCFCTMGAGIAKGIKAACGIRAMNSGSPPESFKHRDLVLRALSHSVESASISPATL